MIQKHVSMKLWVSSLFSSSLSLSVLFPTWSLACSLGNHTANHHCPCTYRPGVLERNDNVSITPVLSSSPPVVSSVVEQLGVSTQDTRTAGTKGAGSSWGDPGLVLLEAGLEESVTLVPGRAVLCSAGLEITAFSCLQTSMWVLKVSDLKLKHPNRTDSLNPERAERRAKERIALIYYQTCTVKAILTHCSDGRSPSNGRWFTFTGHFRLCKNSRHCCVLLQVLLKNVSLGQEVKESNCKSF